MEILDLLNEESISGAAVVDLVYKFDENSYCECLSISNVRFKKIFHPQTPLSLRMRGKYALYTFKQLMSVTIF